MAKTSELVSMKLPARDKTAEERMYPSMSEAKEPEYPYGLVLNLEEDQLKQLGITTLPAVGASLTITAAAEICSTGEYESQDGGVRRSISIQITALKLGAVDAAAS